MGAARLLFPLAIVGGGVALILSNAKANEKKKKIDKALDLGLDDCMVSESQLEAFAKDYGYHVYYFTTAADKQVPKPAYSSDSQARAFDATDCRFERWSGSAWVEDTATNNELDQWLADNTPPEPPSTSRAIPENEIDKSLFTEWWYQAGYSEGGVMGFWIDVHDPQPGTDWLIPTQYDDFVIATDDGALWFHDNGWHPAQKLAQEYDEWYAATH